MPKLAKIITLNGKAKEIATSKPVKAKIITLNMKSKEIITSNQLLSQIWQKWLL